MYLSIIFIPLINYLFISFFGFFFKLRFALYFFINMLILTFISCNIIFFEVILSWQNTYIILSQWISCDYLQVFWGFRFDVLTTFMLWLVSFISLLVHIYSLNYMEEDPHILRFFSYLSLFTFFMFILVSADNYLQMFLGWEV